MDPQQTVILAPFTSLAVGGPAERFYTCRNSEELISLLSRIEETEPLTVIGYGANVLISDKGLPGTVLQLQGGAIRIEDSTVIADAGVWWDDLVQYAIKRNLWGLELMSAIPGGVSAAIVGNVAAYGQAVSDILQWVDVWNRETNQLERLDAADLVLQYRHSKLQDPAFSQLIILRAGFGLSPTALKDVAYQAALDIAAEQNFDLSTLTGRRDTIIETRSRSGSLWDFRTPNAYLHTAGSFFRNPLVDQETAEKIIAFDETGKTADTIRKMNQIHGGDSLRVSAAHVLLAAGFERGQTWGSVRLHPDHILKIENTGGATAQNIYDVAMEIIRTAQQKLGVELSPEVRFVGEFTDTPGK